jgi:redox-sensitive bicupin YhaK (pirin superfamily)
VWHAEGKGEDEVREGKAGSEMRGVLFWVNLARKDRGVEPSGEILNPQDVPVRQDGDARVHRPPSLADEKTEERRSSPATDKKSRAPCTGTRDA